MELEAPKPSHRTFPALGDAFEYLVDVNALVLHFVQVQAELAHAQRHAVHEADVCAFA